MILYLLPSLSLPHTIHSLKNQGYRGFLYFVLFGFLGPHPLHMEVPRLGEEWELQLPATATATPDQSRI